ncbi:cell division protein FtsQ/DivIB [Cellulomonas sp. McL0617]|uniref:cell division protein FtsQ/DivIB n=1 Tax=Cellulomonas sp. McL0617 TaxID=3415675 RepID=UPI003CF43536
MTTYSAGRVRAYNGPVVPPVVSTSSIARFAERARARRNLARRQLILTTAVVVAVVGLGWLLFASPVLALDPTKIEVQGAGTVVAVDQVQAVVAAHAGTPLPRLDTVSLRDELLDVPGVREARVTRAWPAGLSVTLVAREPVAAVPDASTGKGFALLDQDGVQVGRVDAAPAGLPVVDVPVGDKRTLTAVLGVLEQLPADLLAQVEGVSAHTQDTVSMKLRDGVQVEWGSAHETPLKIAVLKALRASPAAAGASVIDVSAPRLPITK